MRFDVKAVSMTALGIFSFAVSVSGVSLADDNVPTIPAAQPVTSSLSSSAVDQPVLPVIFGAAKEVVQPLQDQKQPDPFVPAATPERSYASLAAMVGDIDTSAPLDEETRCLATAIFYEARSESLEGQLAVARVIINRASSARFGNSLCGVVRQPGQFSFVRKGVIPAANMAGAQGKNAIAIAQIALSNAWTSKAEGALYFHARRVSPSWARSRVAVIDNHIFYR